jgi:hypothetical protein
MDYHAHRFNDCSLLAFSQRGRLLAMLPAEISGTTVTTHRGLTYGGWITPMRHFDGSAMMQLFHDSLHYLRNLGATELIYTPLPHIYPLTPADEDRYALFRLGATMTSCVLSSAINLRNPAPRNESTRQSLKLAKSSGVTVHESTDYPKYWAILEECLMSRHAVTPVHTLEEITRLVSLFPENIRLYTASLDGEIVAGALIYFCSRTAKVQYMASTPRGREVKALTAVIDHVATRCCASLDFLDMGGSTESNGNILNSGLLLQKSGLGATGIACPTFTLPL